MHRLEGNEGRRKKIDPNFIKMRLASKWSTLNNVHKISFIYTFTTCLYFALCLSLSHLDFPPLLGTGTMEPGTEAESGSQPNWSINGRRRKVGSCYTKPRRCIVLVDVAVVAAAAEVQIRSFDQDVVIVVVVAMSLLLLFQAVLLHCTTAL